MTYRRPAALAFACVVALASLASGQSIELTPSHADGIYAAGERATFTVTVRGDAKALTDVQYRFRPASVATTKFGPLDVSSGSAEVGTTSDKPGTVMVEVTAKGADGKVVRGVSGAVFGASEIKPSAPRPADFDAFWKGQLEELAKVPVDAKVEAFQDVGGGAEYAHVELGNIDGSHVYGQLARPAGGGKHPAIVVFQYAGVYPLKREWAIEKARAGYLCLNVIAHDIRIDMPDEEYKKLADGKLKGYAMIGNESRETSYFRRMVLGTIRTVDYVASREDWDGKVLLVSGTSQGGFQSVACAGLSPKVTGVIVTVPAGADTMAVSAGRAPGWPYWRGDEKVMETSRYYDPVNFAAHVTCPVLVGVGLADVTATPSGVIAMFNQMPSTQKRLVTMPQAEHKGPNGNYPAVIQSWLAAAKAGEALPMGK